MDKAQRVERSAALLLGSIIVAASIRFASVASVQIISDLCDLGLTIGFVKTVE